MTENPIQVRREFPAVGNFLIDNWLSLDELKSHLSIAGNDEDLLLQNYRSSALQLIEKITGLNFKDHTRFYLFSSVRDGVNYLFNGISVDSSGIEVRKHDISAKFYDFAGQDIVTHHYNDSCGRIKSVYVGTVDEDFITVKTPIVWTAANHPIIKTVLMSLTAEMYHKRELAVNSNVLGSVVYTQLSTYRVI